MAYEEVVNGFLKTMAFDQNRSRLSIAGTEVSFHCDKFNTRILKNFEDVMGYEDAANLLFEMAERTTYDSLKKLLSDTPLGDEFKSLSPEDKIGATFEIFKVLAYGSIVPEEITSDKAVFTSKHSYLAEGWLENRDNWHLDERLGPACHDIRGHLAAVMELVFDKEPGSYKVTEKQCRAYKDASICEFVVEVK